MKRKIWKKILAFMLASSMIFGDSAIVFAVEAQPREASEAATEEGLASAVMTVAESEAAVVNSGSCSDDWRVTWTYYEDGVLKIEGTGAMTKFSYSGYESERPWQPYASEIREVIIGDEITSISQYAFEGIESIENIVLGTNVAEIGRYAFGNTTPKSITLPNGDFTDMFAFPEYSYSSDVHDYFITVKIREDATAVCSTFLYHGDVEAFQVIEAADETAPVNYASLDGVLYNADYSTLIAYPQRRQEKKYTVAETTKVLESASFYGSYYVEQVTLPEGLEIISSGAFQSCENLREVNIPDTVIEIETKAFRECYSLKEINIPDSVTTIETGAFQYCEALENVIIGDGITEIPDIAFNSCYGIKTLKFGRNVTSIREAAFSPIFSGGASEVSLCAETGDEFSDTEYLMIEEMLIPVKEVTVAEDSFAGVNARKVLLYSDTASGSDSVFLGFPGTETFEIIGLSREDAKANYTQRDGVLFDTEYKELVSYPKGRKDVEYRIADGITDIHTKAFYNADYIQKLYIPDSVSFIGTEAFAECDNLTIYCDADSYAAQYAEENEVPYSTQENNIEFTLLKKYSVVPAEEPLVVNDRISDYDVIVTKDDVRVLGCKVYRENIVLPPDLVGAGDVLKIYLTSKTGETLDYTTEVTLDDAGYASTEFEVVQKGRCKVSPIGADISSVILFDMEGNRLESAACTTESYVSGCYDAGTYQVMVIYGEDSNWPFNTLAEFEDNSYVGGAYTLETVEITDNVVTELGEISVEKIDVMSAVYLDDDSCYFANTDVVSQNGLILVRAEYQFQETEEEITPKALRVTIPENCSYVSGSMKVDGEFTEQVNETETGVIVLIEELSGKITFNLKPSDFGIIQSRAVLEFETEKGNLAAALGNIEVLAPYVSLETGTKTTEEEIVVSGVTLPETEVKIYDGPYKIGTAKSSKSGRWTAMVKLISVQNGSVHNIKAVINEGTEEEKHSNTVSVLYEWSVEVIEFKARYLWEGSFYSKWFEADLLDKKFIKYPSLAFQPAAPVTFIVRLSDNDKAEKVYIVNTKAGKEQLIEAEYSKGEDCWVAKERFNKGLPGALSVRVIEKKAEKTVDKNVEIFIDPSSVSDELKNAEYEEIVNEYEEETGIGEYEGKITLADEEKSEIGIKVTGKELATDSVREQELIREGYKKIESADDSSVYYSKIEIRENGDVALKTVEIGYDPLDVITSATQQTALVSTGKAIEKGTGVVVGETLGSVLGDCFGTITDSVGYVSDLLDEEGIYQRINEAYEYLTELYTNDQISKQEYSKKLDELIEISDNLITYQLLKGAFFVVSGTSGLLCPAFAFAISLTSTWVYELMDVDFDLMFADFYNIQLRWIVDPSGYVYEAIPNNRLESVTAAIYYQEQDETGNITSVFWDAGEYDQMNPLITEADGVYAWDVPEGYWKVVFEKDGYESAETEWLPVPPMQTDINIGMVSKNLTALEGVNLYDEYAILIFDQYVRADSITSDTVKIYSNDTSECDFTVEPVDGAEQKQGVLASQYRLVFDKKLSTCSYAVEISEAIKDYADRNLKEKYTFTKEVKSVVKEIKAKLPKQIVMGEECTIPITIVTEGNLKDYEVEFVSEAENAFAVLGVSGADENGTFDVKIHPNLPDQVNLNVYVDGVKLEKIPLEILINEIPDIPLELENDEVIRLSGATRYETGYKVADVLKERLGIDKFDAVVVATGKNFADALAGSYLAVQKNAPIILTNGKEDNVAKLHEYIQENVVENGTVYILGGDAAVPESVEGIEGYVVKRLFGNSRYDTNLEILKEAGMAGDEIIIATGKSFADSLSASAAKLPILLVKPNGTLNSAQKEILSNRNKIYIVGGEGAVSEAYETELKNYGSVERVFGQSRYDTSVAIANTFFESVDEVVIASGKNFPDGLCGGPLAAAINAPLILTADGKTDAAKAYVQEVSAEAGYVLGGAGAIGDDSIVGILELENADKIILK